MQAQQAAELVRDIGRREAVNIFEGAHAPRALRDPQPFFGALALGDVDQQSREAHRTVLLVELAVTPAVHPQEQAIRAQDPEFLREQLGPGQNACDCNAESGSGPRDEWA